MQVFMDTHKDRLDHGLPVTWHTDNGGEFLSSDMDEFCKEFAIKRTPRAGMSMARTAMDVTRGAT